MSDLQSWFGFRASFCVMPRVLMEAMPEEWQDKMAALLHEYSETFDTSLGGAVRECTVCAKDHNGKFIRLPNAILNYRHPNKLFIDSLRKAE